MADLRLDPFWSTLPIGTGPYKLVNYVPKQTLEYVRHDSYHFGTPQIERMIWTQIPEAATQLLALEGGENDYCQMSLTRDDYDRVNENPDLYIMEAYEPRLPQMAMHYRNFGDLRVRQAVCAAVDRNALLAAAGGEGYATILDYYFMNPWASEGAIKWGDVHSYDPDKAKALLAEAGWDSSQTIELETNNPNAQVAILQEQLQAVGINAEIITVESTSPSLYEEGEYQLIIHGLAYSDPFTPANNFTCATAKPNGSSLTQYCNSAYDMLMEQEAQAATQEERAEVYRQLQEILVNDAASVLTIYQPNRGVFNKKVQVEKWAWYAFDHSWEWSIA
jgi:peptide/nickel transport system substrate-binding protein